MFSLEAEYEYLTKNLILFNVKIDEHDNDSDNNKYEREKEREHLITNHISLTIHHFPKLLSNMISY